MKVSTKEFEIYKGQRPKVLLLGNGLNRMFKGGSWDDLLNALRDEKKYPLAQEKYIIPNGFKAPMLANGDLKTKISEYIKDDKNQDKIYSCNSNELLEVVRAFALLPFDFILTTNYSYELELALSNVQVSDEKKIKKLLANIGDSKAESKYAMRTFNRVSNKDYERDIWHIHGEYRKPDSIILGQYYYGNLLTKYSESLKNTYISTEKSVKTEKPKKINTWTEAFMLGDVYIVGLGMDFSEVDLWWLLEKKKINQNNYAGSTYFYNPLVQENIDRDIKKAQEGPEACKTYLMETYDAKVKNFGFKIKDYADYPEFYKLVYEDLKKELLK